jgi:hypothetical protein
MRAAAACAGISLLLASCVIINNRTVNERTPEPRGEQQAGRTNSIRGAVSGRKQLIETFLAAKPDCTSPGYPTLKVAKAPQHGQVSVEQGTGVAAFPKENPRSACNGQEFPATVVYYTSEPGFTGTDSVDFERIGVAGAYGYHAYTINVR